MQSPVVSIIMATYNSSAYVEQTINSIIAQSFSDWELLITDDCSKDNTLEILERIQVSDPRVQYYQNQRNRGAAVSRNRSLNRAQGRYIAFLIPMICGCQQSLSNTCSICSSTKRRYLLRLTILLTNTANHVIKLSIKPI